MAHKVLRSNHYAWEHSRCACVKFTVKQTEILKQRS